MNHVPGTGKWRAFGIAALAASALALAGCGGGGSSDSFSVSAYVSGQAMGNYGSGNSSPIYIHAGQSIELDAAEPVVWTLYVGNTAVSGAGTTVQYGGAFITLSAESDSRILVDTTSNGPLSADVPITMVATSSIDSSLVASVDVFITN